MIYQAKKEDMPAAAALAAQLFHCAARELEREFAELAGSGDCAVFLSAAGGRPVGFAQCQLRRDYVEGTASSPVGYLEGIFVLPAYRNQGRARALLERCEQWAREKGCTEFASDCELDNEASLAFHLQVGFTEANRIICFHKTLKD